MTLEELRVTGQFCLSRTGRFLIAQLLVPHRLLSTSEKNGGLRDDIRFLVNHQSCEATDHRERFDYIHELGLDGYHDAACLEVSLPPDSVAMMGTAANMNYASIVEQCDEDLSVTAVVTAGVHGNATCAGDPAEFRESERSWEKIVLPHGTINTILLVNRPLTAAALARAVVTMTEGKSAALQRLGVRSLYSQDSATGTGTDQYCLAAPLEGPRPLTSASPHVKLGELIGLAARDATLEALRWQNGLEPSYTRGLFHALSRYALTESSFFEDVAPLLTERELDLLKKNSKSVFYEPLVGACAHAIAAVLDRGRYGMLPATAVREALRQQAATLAASLAARPDRWAEFHASLDSADLDRPASIILAAVALGWSSKWK